ncbi:MAG TPA: MFS transporter [Candidatus Limnocylindria bacterium]|nr:MFS transporter [Candidatus Limnocylindria bacterium]
MQRDDTSKTMVNKSAGAEIAAPMAPSGASFGLQAAPVFFLTAIFFLNFIARVILSPLLPTIEKELAIGHGQAGFFFFLISAGYLSGLLGSGFLSSRTSHRQTILLSGAGVGLALFLLSGSSSLWAMRLGLYALGLAAGLYMPSAIATITALVDQRHWGKAIAVHELAPNLAFFTGPFVAELFLRHSTWRAALAVLAGASLLITMGYYRYGQGGRFAGESPASSAFGVLVRTSAFWIMLILFGMGVSSTVGIYAMLPLYLISDRQIEATWANTVTALSRSYGPVFGMLGGWASDRLGPKRTMVVSLIVTGVLTLFLGFVADNWISAVVIIQPALAVWFFPAGFAALAVIAPPQARNLAVGFTIPFGYLIGGGAIPTFIGMMGDAGLFALGFAITGLLITGAGVLALSLKLPRTIQGGSH